jgi:hypothetical protein
VQKLALALAAGSGSLDDACSLAATITAGRADRARAGEP